MGYVTGGIWTRVVVRKEECREKAGKGQGG